MSSIHVLDRNGCSERLVRWDSGEVYRVGELRRRHAGLCNNVTHRDRVAGACLDLLPVRDGLSNAEVDAGK